MLSHGSQFVKVVGGSTVHHEINMCHRRENER
jgi:hypothetical protein